MRKFACFLRFSNTGGVLGANFAPGFSANFGRTFPGFGFNGFNTGFNPGFGFNRNVPNFGNFGASFPAGWSPGFNRFPVGASANPGFGFGVGFQPGYYGYAFRQILIFVAPSHRRCQEVSCLRLQSNEVRRVFASKTCRKEKSRARDSCCFVLTLR